MNAMPLLIVILCLMAIAYRYYSAFLAAKVAALDDSRATPAVLLNDGQNYHPTSKWVLFGHHFAAISGAGPLIGPVLAAQFGYMPGLLWIIIGVCLGGAVQDFLVLSASVRRGGKSLAQIAYHDVGKVAGTSAMIAILFIIVIALAGLGKVVVKALGGETVKYPNAKLVVPAEGMISTLEFVPKSWRWDKKEKLWAYEIPRGWQLEYAPGKVSTFNEAFTLETHHNDLAIEAGDPLEENSKNTVTLPADAQRTSPGSPWGLFTIACTIPIALFVGLYMYKIRPGKVIEASLIGGALTLAATFAGGWVAEQAWGMRLFNLSAERVTIAMAVYGFIAAVLPVWVLLAPRDYLSSFLKIGTIALLVIGTLIASPKLQAPAINQVFLHGGPTVPGNIFPFLFITIMCGAISGFHALVSSGTTPKMISREGDARTIGYGAMLIEGLVGVVAMIAAAALPTNDYYAMNTELAKVPEYQQQILQVSGVEHSADNLPQYEQLTREPTLRGRTGGAVTLAVGMAHIFDEALRKVSHGTEAAMQQAWKYWYHFAIMFEALFILTTIDAGTRIGRFLLQEAGGAISPRLANPNWWPGAIVSTALIVAGWAYFIDANNFAAIWAMFGVANQMLAAIALAIVSAYLVNEGRGKYLWVTIVPMCVVTLTTSTAAVELIIKHWNTYHAQMVSATPVKATITNSVISGTLTLAMLVSAYVVIIACMRRCFMGPGEQELARLRGSAAGVVTSGV